MPSFTGKTFSNFYKNILAINESANTGVGTVARLVQDGDGNNSSLSLSDDLLRVRPRNDDTVGTLVCQTQGGSDILAVASQVAANTQFKEMGLYDFSPTAGYHYPLIANTMFIPTGATAFAGDNDWGNGTDPATTLDVSGLTAQENAVAVYWYLQNNITLDEVRYMVTADSTASLNFHLFAYDLIVSVLHGDLTGGVVHANASVTATATSIKTGTFTLDTADIDASKVVIGFVENASDTGDVTVAFNIKYHIR